MHTVELIDGTGRVTAYRMPGKWEECTVQQIGAIAAVLSAAPAYTDEELNAAHIRLRLFHELSGISDADYLRVEPSDLLDLRHDELGAACVALLPQLDWALAAPAWHKSLLPEVTVRKRTFKGPRDGLSGMTLRQWGFCDLLAERLGSGDPNVLPNLLGALYHDKSKAWDNAEIEERGAQLAHLDARTQLAAIWNYRALREMLVRRFHRCFRGGTKDRHGVQGMVVRLAGEKFGTVDAAWHADLVEVMIHVEQSLEEVDRMKQQQ